MKLVPYSEKVFDAMYKWQSDDETRKDMGGLSVPMREDELMFTHQQFLNGNNAVLGVATEEGTIVGAFIMEQIQPRHKRLNIHIVFDKEYLRHVKEGTTLFLDYIFNERNFDWLHCYLGDSQKKSIALAENLGFLKRCTIPEYFNYSDGVCSAHLYSLHKSKRKDK